jgi:hypothetical protein
MTFIDDSFVADNGNAGSYFKPREGQNNKVRILSEKPILGYVQWTNDNKPMRWKFGENKPEADYQEGRPRKFLAVVVWNYQDECVQVWEITQKTLIDALNEITRDSDFGHPNNYDLKITRIGKDINTQYQLMPLSAPLLEHVEAALQNPIVNLDALFNGEDPFA